MAKQIEKAGTTLEQLNVTLGLPADSPGMVSGGMIENFEKGWAIHIMPPSKVGHFFNRLNFSDALSVCGHQVNVRWLYGIGSFNKCKRCVKAVNRGR